MLSEEEDVFCADFLKLVDKRLALFKKRDLPDHLSVLSNWETKLKKIEEWYKSSGDEFKIFTESMKQQHKQVSEKSAPLSRLFHDHPYCLKAYRKAPANQALVPHLCGSQCGQAERSGRELHIISPLEVPLRYGWQRVILQRCGDADARDAYYVAPCGRRLRSMDEVKYYLDLTKTYYLSGVNFTFDPLCSLACPTYDPVASKALVFIMDISNGKERVPVSCVNEFNYSKPDCLSDKFQYLTTRTFESGIGRSHEPGPQCRTTEAGGDISEADRHAAAACRPMEDMDMPELSPAEGKGQGTAKPAGAMTESEFLVCCSCTDNCANRSKCECWQLTLEEAKVIGNTRYSVGYVHQRLKRPQHSAVYECNSHCKCGNRCSNYVVKGGVVHRLQLFHTGCPQKNWGLRTLDDIPMGTFVCSYMGHVFTEVSAEKRALQHGDEYFADLDYIEVMEYHKAGYEPEVVISDTSSLASETNDRLLLSLTATPPKRRDSVETPPPNRQDSMETTPQISSSETTSRTSSGPSDDVIIPSDSEVEEAAGASPRQQAPPTSSPLPSPTAKECTPRLLRRNSTRQFYNEDFNYIIDAKSHGNMARYINHSCDPNLFVQNVFVDTHDLRFPWVAFFAKRRIKAMEELTWDYNYDIGSVDNKEIWCLCGSQNCRGRLL